MDRGASDKEELDLGKRGNGGNRVGREADGRISLKRSLDYSGSLEEGEEGSGRETRVWQTLSLTLSCPSGSLGTKARPFQSFLCSVCFLFFVSKFRGQACRNYLG